MKKAIYILASLFIMSIIGCTHTQQTVDESGLDVVNVRPDNAVANQPDYFRNLADFLYRVP
jgi:F420-0:gamma-glutamyl ligase-like protein